MVELQVNGEWRYTMPARVELSRGATLSTPAPVTVHGSFPCPTGGVGSLHGQFRLRRPLQITPRLMVVGCVGGALVDSAGRTMGYASRRLALPLAQARTAEALRDALEGLEISLGGLPVLLHVPTPDAPAPGACH